MSLELGWLFDCGMKSEPLSGRIFLLRAVTEPAKPAAKTRMAKYLMQNSLKSASGISCWTSYRARKTGKKCICITLVFSVRFERRDIRRKL